MRGFSIVIICIFLVALSSGEIAPALEEEMESMNWNEMIEVIVQTEEPNIHESNFSENLDVEVVRNYEELDAAFLDLPVSSIENVDDRRFIQRIEPNYEVNAMLSDSRPQINAVYSGDYNYTGENISVGVMDSGIAEHRHLEIEQQKDFTGEGQGDLNGHGTHVAGIIGSQHQDYRGIAPEASIYDVKVLDSEGSGKASQLLRGIEYVMREEMDVAVMSLGSRVDNCNGNDVMSRSADLAVNEGITVVAAVGNEGSEERTVTAPGCSRTAITVGSVDKQDRIAGYSSRGPTTDQRIKPDLVAPGTGIVSTSRTGGLVKMSGTSMAAPHVAGQAAVLLSAGEDPRNVRHAIINSSEDLGSPQNSQGGGRADVEASLRSIGKEVEASSQGRWSRFKSWFKKIIRI